MNDLASLDQVWRTYSSRQWKGCCQINAKQVLGKDWRTNKQTHQGVLEVKKVDVTSWKCHRLPWNSGSKVLPEQVIGCTHYWLWIGCTGTVITRTMSGFLGGTWCTKFMKCGIFHQPTSNRSITD